MKILPTISVIVPTHREASTILKLISHIKNSSTTKQVQQIIIADSGEDNTAELVRQASVTIVKARKQRAAAMNDGANQATGTILYFLHADTYPPIGWDIAILNAFEYGSIAGSFRMRFDNNHWFLRASGWMTHLKWGWLRFGDQSLFVRKNVFDSIHGFNEDMTILEDLEIVSRIKRVGSFVVLPYYVTTSARKFQKYGYYRLQAIYIYINILYHLGFSQKYLLITYQKLLKHSGKS